MIAALAEAGAALDEPRYTEAAVACAEFILRDLRDADGRLLRTYNDGGAKLDGYLEDHAFLLEALIALFETTCEERWFTEARALADTLIARFADPENGGFFSTAADGEALIARRKDLEDSPDPLRRLQRRDGPAAPVPAHRRGRVRAPGARRAERCCAISPRATPPSFGHLLQALHWRFSPAAIACAVPHRPFSRIGSQHKAPA